MSKHKRGKEYIDPQVQGALWRRLVVHWLAYTMVVMVLALGLEWMSNPFRVFSEVASDAWWTYSPLLLVMLFLLPAFIFDSVRFSHRIVGPVFRIRQVLQSLAAGESQRHVQFRKNDFWKEISADLNLVIDRLDNLQQAEESEASASATSNETPVS